MRLDIDCVRAVLLEAEACDFDEMPLFSDFANNVMKRGNYSPLDIEYACHKLDEANFLKIITSNSFSRHTPNIIHIVDITYAGHQFLADIREETVWDNVKGIAQKIGSTSVNGITQIASNVVAELIKSHFGL